MNRIPKPFFRRIPGKFSPIKNTPKRDKALKKSLNFESNSIFGEISSAQQPYYDCVHGLNRSSSLLLAGVRREVYIAWLRVEMW